MAVAVVVDLPLFHLDRPFTYRVPERLRAGVHFGSRVKVPFGNRRRVDGWVIDRADDLPDDVRDIERVVSPLPAFGPAELALARWVADRYAATLAATLRLAAPPRVAAVDRDLGPSPGISPGVRGAPSEGARSGLPEPLRQAPWTPPARGAGRRRSGDPLVEAARRGPVLWRPLPGEDRAARIVALVSATLAAGRGAIVAVPELAAGSAVADAVRAAFPDAADLASDLSERRRYQAWAELRRGQRRVAVGGRSAVLAPMAHLGLVVVDDEANPAHKERRAPRYTAREVALHRAAVGGAACVLTGTVPSAELAGLVREGRCRVVAAARATERARRPLVEVVDPDDEGPSRARLHPRALRALRAALGRGESAFVLVPRRGAAAAGTGARTAGQVRAELARVLPGAQVWRLDREVVAAGASDLPWAGQGPGIVVGTVAGVKDKPPLAGCRTVVVAAADAALGQAEVRAAEDAYRTWSRAAAWCGPRSGPGRLVLQVRDGGHHAVQALVRWDPDFFWRHELPRRARLGFPPARRLVLVEGPDPAEADGVLAGLAEALGPEAELLGPAALGRGWRIIAKVDSSEAAARALRPLLAAASRNGGPRFSVDVDPVEVLGPGPSPRAGP